MSSYHARRLAVKAMGLRKICDRRALERLLGAVERLDCYSLRETETGEWAAYPLPGGKTWRPRLFMTRLEAADWREIHLSDGWELVRLTPDQADALRARLAAERRSYETL